ncbi:hypothetical protein GCM10022420_070200 [Streptomyces iranensis]
MRAPHFPHGRRVQKDAWAALVSGGLIGHLFIDMRPGDAADRVMNSVVRKSAPRREVAHRSTVGMFTPQPAYVRFVQNSGARLVRISGLGPTERRRVIHPAPGGAIDRLGERPAGHTDRTRELIYRRPVLHPTPRVTHNLGGEHSPATEASPV